MSFLGIHNSVSGIFPAIEEHLFGGRQVISLKF